MGFKVVLVDPKDTSTSREHRESMLKHGLDKHTTSAYLIANRAREQVVHINPHKPT